jgi:hypothetical protein
MSKSAYRPPRWDGDALPSKESHHQPADYGKRDDSRGRGDEGSSGRPTAEPHEPNRKPSSDKPSAPSR